MVRKPTKERSLAFLSPEIAKEWHPTLNGSLTPDDVFNGCRKRVWWQCQKVKEHVWDAEIRYRTGKDKGKCRHCPSTRRKRIRKIPSPEKSLAFLSPEIAKEWHPTLNGSLTPNDVFNSSDKKVWWQCQKVEDHVYESRIAGRTKDGKGCRYCFGTSVLSPERSLAFLSPEIAKEWHPTLNGSLTPDDVFNGSDEKVWWQCRRNKDHVWDASIGARTRRGDGCRICGQGYQTSKPEMRLLAELRSIFKNVISQKKIKHNKKTISIDIFLSDIQVAIEYDGFYYHISEYKQKKDSQKNKFLEKEGITLIRIREIPLRKIKENDILIENQNLGKKELDQLISIITKIKKIDSSQLLMNPNKYLEQSEFINEELFKIYIKNFPSPLPENSLQKLFPDISKEWHFEKNYPLTPFDFSPGSNQPVWWQCQKVKNHVYESLISSRAGNKKTGCSICAGKIISKERSLAFLSPEIAKEWHPTLNGSLTPNDVFNGSADKAWWQCQKVKDHIWKGQIKLRTRKGERRSKGCRICNRANKF